MATILSGKDINVDNFGDVLKNNRGDSNNQYFLSFGGSNNSNWFNLLGPPIGIGQSGS